MKGASAAFIDEMVELLRQPPAKATGRAGSPRRVSIADPFQEGVEIGKRSAEAFRKAITQTDT